MEVMRDPGESKFESWAWWRKRFRDPKWLYGEALARRGYHWPGTYTQYIDAIRNVKSGGCNYCDGAKIFIDKETGQAHWCICHMLKWQNYFWEEQADLSSRVERKSLDLIVPYGSTPEKKAMVRNAVTIARNWIEKPDRWILFIGNAGTGKTHIVSAILSEYNPIAIFITGGDFKTRMFEALKTKTVNDVSRALQKIPLLIFDDWGAEFGNNNQWIDSEFENIINERYNDFRSFPTIVTTNLQKDVLVNSSSWNVKRAADRLLDVRNYTVQLRCDSYRRRPDENGTSTYVPNSAGIRRAPTS